MRPGPRCVAPTSNPCPSGAPRLIPSRDHRRDTAPCSHLGRVALHSLPRPAAVTGPAGEANRVARRNAILSHPPEPRRLARLAPHPLLATLLIVAATATPAVAN